MVSLFPRELFFAELDRLQRSLDSVFEPATSIRGFGLGGYPQLNVGTTPTSVEVYAFAPGIDPAKIEVTLDRGVLTIAGERTGVRAEAPASGHGNGSGNGHARQVLHVEERFTGRFRRVVTLPEDIDPNGVTAEARDGALRVSIKRLEAAQPRRIAVQ